MIKLRTKKYFLGTGSDHLQSIGATNSPGWNHSLNPDQKVFRYFLFFYNKSQILKVKSKLARNLAAGAKVRASSPDPRFFYQGAADPAGFPRAIINP